MQVCRSTVSRPTFSFLLYVNIFFKFYANALEDNLCEDRSSSDGLRMKKYGRFLNKENTLCEFEDKFNLELILLEASNTVFVILFHKIYILCMFYFYFCETTLDLRDDRIHHRSGLCL